ncbi:SusC/RagA family TonB-linked outer membrane protein [Niabella terrae]
MFMGFSFLAFSQTGTVSGTVIDENGAPVPFATVAVKGTETAVSADADGKFTISAAQGATLVFTATGFNEAESVVSGEAMNVVLTRSDSTIIPEVVVTGAFNTKRAARGLSSNTQTVSSDQLNTIRQQNINNALAGKVAGIQVRSQSVAKLGVETVIRLRGENGFGIGDGAIYVVDGTIVPSGGDINMDDIENVSVLQGPAASALFGSDGSNGAIVITTKRARKNQKGMGLEINSGVQFDKVYIMPDFQNSYAGGNDYDMHKFTYIPGFHPEEWASLDGKYYHDYQEDVSWGPRMLGQEYIPWYSWYPGTKYTGTTASLVPQKNNARDYFNTGVTAVNNVNFSKAGEGFNFRASYTNTDIKGLIPTSWLKRNMFNVNTSVDLGKKLTLSANITYLDQRSNAENDDGYSNNTSGSFNQWFHRDLDIDIMREFTDYLNVYGQQASWNHTNPSGYDPANPTAFYRPYYWFSPYSWQKGISNVNDKTRLYGNASLAYKPIEDLTVRFTYRKAYLNQNTDRRQYYVLQQTNAGNTSSGFNYWELISGRSATWQGFGYSTNRSDRQNFEFLASYNKKLTEDWEIGANAGVDILKTAQEVTSWNSLGGLNVPDEFIISNSVKANPPARTLINVGRRALFLTANVGFKKAFYIDGTFRRDYWSTELEPIDTKSGGFAVVFNDLLGLNNSTPLNYLKLRGSIGQIANALGAYDNSLVYANLYPIPFDGSVRMATEPNSGLDPNLHGSVNTEKELGLELRFLRQRLTLNATYWDRTNKDFPYSVAVAPTSGISSLRTNVGEIKKKGIELQVNALPVDIQNLKWNINVNWAYLLNNDVISISPGVPSFTISSGQAGTDAYVQIEEGHRWGQLVGRAIMRIDGQPVIDEDGLFVMDVDENDAVKLKNYGSVLPRYTGGVQNSFTLFNNFILDASIDFSSGGKFMSMSKAYGTATGLWSWTATANDKGNPIRDAPEDGGGVHVVGVDIDGNPVDTYVAARPYFEQFAYGTGIVEPFISDLTFVKLRELSLGYLIPLEKIGRVGNYITNATFSIVARNPWLIYAKQPGFDPSEISTNYGEDGQLPGTRSIGFNLKIGF